MNNAINLLTNFHVWEFKKRKSLFKNTNETMIEIRNGKKRATIKSVDQLYTIRNKGFWNPTSIIENDKQIIAQLKRTMGSNKVLVIFENGETYYLKSKNAVFVKLSIYSSNQQEIACYKLISKYKAHLNIDKTATDVNESDLLLLIALGCFVFRGVINENKVIPLNEIVFSTTVKENAEQTGI